jgi:hypothetical protein
VNALTGDRIFIYHFFVKSLLFGIVRDRDCILFSMTNIGMQTFVINKIYSAIFFKNKELRIKYKVTTQLLKENTTILCSIHMLHYNTDIIDYIDIHINNKKIKKLRGFKKN